MFRSLLIPVDLSPFSDRVLGRVALLPLADDARLTLLHVVPTSKADRVQRRAAADATKALREEAKSLAPKLPKRVKITPLVRVGAAAQEIAECAATLEAELIAMGRGGGRGLRDIFLGSTAERVIRRGQLPVLVVRLPPRHAYRRPAVALDLDDAAPRLLDLLLRVIPPPRPPVTLIHAYDVPYQQMVYSSLSREDLEDYRARCREDAREQIDELCISWRARSTSPSNDLSAWRMHLRHGPARAVVAKAVEKEGTDLLMLGTRGNGIAQAFLGSTAGDLLRHVACDVLVVPPTTP